MAINTGTTFSRDHGAGVGIGLGEEAGCGGDGGDEQEEQSEGRSSEHGSEREGGREVERGSGANAPHRPTDRSNVCMWVEMSPSLQLLLNYSQRQTI